MKTLSRTHNEFKGKTVVITGADRGIGEGIAERFASDGANIVLASIDKGVFDTSERIAREYGVETLAVLTDVTKEEDVQNLYKKASEKFKSIDISVQNAGIITIEHFDKMTRDEFDRVLAVNTTGVWLCCREAAKYMIKQGRGGRLINSSSGQGRKGFIYTPHYAASKMGVIGVTQSLALELAPHNITVNAFCPGIIVTDMWDYNDRVWGQVLSTEKKQYKKGELMAEWVEGIPLGRAGQPEDVSGLIAFLASEDAAYITGQTVNIDGGMFFS